MSERDRYSCGHRQEDLGPRMPRQKPTTPPTPDRLREIVVRIMGSTVTPEQSIAYDLLKKYIAAERKDARRLERERIALYVTNEGLASLGKEIRALPDEETP